MCYVQHAIDNLARPTVFFAVQRYSLALVPGGATEALYNDPDHDVVYIKGRHGFVSLALESGATLVPTFSFNECNTFGVLEARSVCLRSVRGGSS